MKKRQETQPSLLQFYWYETETGVPSKSIWGQYMGAIHRLADLDEALVEASKHRNVLRRLDRITLIIESYLNRAYELRERTVGLLCAIAGKTGLAKSIKKKSKRSGCLDMLRAGHPKLVDGAEKVLALLDKHMLLRNMHTHEQFLRIGLYAPNGPYEPEDVLMHLQSRPLEYRAMVKLLRVEMRKLVAEYRASIRSLRDAAMAVAKIDYANGASKS